MKVNIGGQKGRKKNKIHGWCIVDIRKGADVCIDIMNSPLPFEDMSMDAVYTSHTLEHLFPDRLPFVLSEFYRVLKKGSKIRVVVPDVDKAIKAYINKDIEYLQDEKNPRKMPCLPDAPLCYLSSWFFTYKLNQKKNKRLEGGHVMCFNFCLLKQFLEKAGFKNVIEMEFGKCSTIFHRCDFNRYRNCSVYVEAEA